MFGAKNRNAPPAPGTRPGPGMTETGNGATPCETNFRDTALARMSRQGHGLRGALRPPGPPDHGAVHGARRRGRSRAMRVEGTMPKTVNGTQFHTTQELIIVQTSKILAPARPHRGAARPWPACLTGVMVDPGETCGLGLQCRDSLEELERLGVGQRLAVLDGAAVDHVAHRELGDLARARARDVGDLDHLRRHVARRALAAET